MTLIWLCSAFLAGIVVADLFGLPVMPSVLLAGAAEPDQRHQKLEVSSQMPVVRYQRTKVRAPATGIWLLTELV